jgi:hypothetical protein
LGPLFQPQNNTQISTISTNCVCTQSQMWLIGIWDTCNGGDGGLYI